LWRIVINEDVLWNGANGVCGVCSTLLDSSTLWITLPWWRLTYLQSEGIYWKIVDGKETGFESESWNYIILVWKLCVDGVQGCEWNECLLAINYHCVQIFQKSAWKSKTKWKNRLFKCLAIKVHMEMLMSIRGFERVGLLWYFKKKVHYTWRNLISVLNSIAKVVDRN